MAFEKYLPPALFCLALITDIQPLPAQELTVQPAARPALHIDTPVAVKASKVVFNIGTMAVGGNTQLIG